VLDFKQENTTFDLKIPKFQFFKIGQPVGEIIWESKTVSASATHSNMWFFSYFLILPDVPANRWNLGILE
jgi:hypothetical protein